MDSEGKEILDSKAEGNLCIKQHAQYRANDLWRPRKIYATYFSAYPGYYFTGDGAKRERMDAFELLDELTMSSMCPGIG